MRNLKILFVSAMLVLVLTVGWQIGAAILANIELRDDMQDVASQLSLHVGLPAPNSNEEFRTVVVNKARHYDIQLNPEQVIVQRTGYSPQATIYLQTSYTVPIRIPGYVFQLRFTPESGKRLF